MISRCAAAVAAAAISAFLAPSAASAADVTLRYSNWLPMTYYYNRDMVMPWLEEIEKVTEGRVKIEVTPKVVGSVAGQYDVIADGLADMGYVVVGYTPGRFPLTEGLELPFQGEDTRQRCPNTWEAFDRFLSKTDTFKDVKILGFLCTSVSHFTMTKEIIDDVNDFQGLKIRTASAGAARTVELLGGIPVTKPTSEIYELASGGVIDGATFPIDPLPGFGLERVLKKITIIPGGIASTVAILPINKAAWEKISEADRKAIMEISGAALAAKAGEVAWQETERVTDILEQAGVEIAVADDKLTADIRERVQPVRDEWIATARQHGLEDPEGMLAVMETPRGN